MAQKWQYLSKDDEATAAGFLEHLALRFFGTPKGPLYHYTTGDNLIKILQSGQLWATQAACLNDATELMYAADQLRSRVDARLKDNSRNPIIDPILLRLSESLADPRVEISPVFVTCFSERADDLSQWRAYSRGEGGYSIEFDPVRLREAGLLPGPDGQPEPQILLVRVEYEPSNHSVMFDDILKWTEQYFLGLGGMKRAPDIEAWAEEFCRYWLENIAFYAPYIKNPCFRDEQEWRLIYYLRPDDPTALQFRQRQSMMTRHIPLRLTKPLPITKVLVGPCRHPRLSQIAAGDLLVAAGYDPKAVKVGITGVPYRSG